MPSFRVWPPAAPTPLDLDGWAQTYAYPVDPPDGWWLRGNMVASLDGAAVAPDGRTRSISSDTDRDLLALLRALSDVILVGAATAVAEGYGPDRVRPEHVRLREAAGQTPVAAVALVSSRLDFDLTGPLFTQAQARTIVLAAAGAPADRLRAARQVADVAVVGEQQVDPAAAVAALVERGHRRLLCEGGPRWLGAVAAAGLLDELCLTVSPVVIGGPAMRVLNTPNPAGPLPMHLASVCCDDESLFLRHTRSPMRTPCPSVASG
ncbi:MAG TPA: dihydrofolate reductase family protein [Sporichthyaceae bacterium]|nr:dihydrofolate reductase family protein [Sporichthyaceae bacterium]